MANDFELKQIVCQGAHPGPRLLVTGGVHGDEFEPMVAIRRLASLLNHHDLSGTATLVPVVNEGAFRRGRRTADDQLDLARVCPGNPHGSPTEQVADKLAQQIRAADFYIDLHTGGTKLSLFPLAGYMLHEDLEIRRRQREMARAVNLPLVWGTDPTLEGRSLSVARDANVPAIYVEYLGGAGCDAAGVDAMVAGCLNVMAQLRMLDRPLPESQVIYDIEETRPNSGFLQAALPAPCDGFFERAVSPGDLLEQGQPIGWIVDPLGRRRVTIAADRSGLVVCLRTFASVVEGDSLGTLIEIERTTHD